MMLMEWNGDEARWELRADKLGCASPLVSASHAFLPFSQ